MKMIDIVRQRNDLSSFLVHLTRDGSTNAKNNLKSIISSCVIEARNPFGIAKKKIEDSTIKDKTSLLDTQKCVCFTETPLEYVRLLTSDIDDRSIQFKPYGIAIPKKLGRKGDINPVWYLDITPSSNWLTEPVNNLIDAALQSENFMQSDIAKLSPLIEQMGSGNTEYSHYRKEFWWEREWRHVNHYCLPDKYFVFAPYSDFDEMEDLIEKFSGHSITILLIDPIWSMEEIIALSRTCCNRKDSDGKIKYPSSSFYSRNDIDPFV